MIEIVVLAILVVGVACGTVLGAGDREVASWTWPVMRPAFPGSEPAEEGAPVAGPATAIVEQETREAA